MSLPRVLSALLERPDGLRTLGPFRLVRPLGRGGFAPVWLAMETHGEVELRLAAVKLFALQGAGEGNEQRLQVLQEAQALCRVEHPNIVRFYALPADSALGVMGLAMEYVAGTALDVRLASVRKLAIRDVIAIGISIASALAAVHRVGLVHRDVKPANVVEAGGVYKLIDFGISAADSPIAESADVVELDGLPLAPSRTLNAIVGAQRNRRISGTVGYIDPVVVAGEGQATPASDLYGLGALLFECATGRLPAAGEVAEGLDQRVIEGTKRPPSVLSLVEVPPLLAQTIDSLLDPEPARRPASAEGVTAMLHAAQMALGADDVPLPGEDVGPFRGLGRFEGHDRTVYFGRMTEVARALDLLRSRGLVALVGASGSGKSSLGRAGLLPAVEAGSLGPWPKRWRSVVLEPGEAPSTALSVALKAIGVASTGSPLEVVERLSEDVAKRDEGVVLFVDQCEELVTVADETSVAHFVEVISLLAERGHVGIKVVVGVRRDILDSVLGLGRLGSIVARGILLVEPLTAASWEAVVEQSLGAYGYSFEDEALRKEVNAALASDPTSMPLLQFALSELWRERDRDRKLITRDAYRKLGGVSGALERHADKTILAMGAGRLESARRVLLALTTAAGTRRARKTDELVHDDAQAVEVVRVLEDARIVVRDGAYATLAHEALLGRWDRLRGWVAEARGERAIAEEAEADARRWEVDQDATLLWRKARLSAARQLMDSGAVALSAGGKAFLRAGMANERRGRAALASGLALLALVTIVFAVGYIHSVGVEQEKTAKALRQEQDTREIAERRTQEVQAAQGRIDLLLKELADSPKKEEVVALQAKIRGGPEAPSVAAVQKASGTARATPAVSSAPAAVAPQPVVDASAPAVRVQVDW